MYRNCSSLRYTDLRLGWIFLKSSVGSDLRRSLLDVVTGVENDVDFARCFEVAVLVLRSGDGMWPASKCSVVLYESVFKRSIIPPFQFVRMLTPATEEQ